MKIFHAHHHRLRVSFGLALAAGLAAVVSCKGEVDAPAGAGTGGSGGSDQIGITKTNPCFTPVQSFAWEAYGPIFSRCIGCHNEFGLARQVGVALRLRFPGEPDFAERNVDVLTGYASRTIQAPSGELPLLLAKPTGQVSHVGGTVVDAESAEGKLLASFVQKLASPPECKKTPDDAAAVALANLELGSPRQTYARAKFALTGQLATPEELDEFTDTEAALDAKLDELMQTEAFLGRAQEMFSDWLLTDAYSSLVRGGDLMDQLGDYPRSGFFEPVCMTEDQNDCCDAATKDCCSEFFDAVVCNAQASSLAIDAVAREPLELVKHVVRNDLPLTELVTANYTVLNPYSAVVYGFTNAQLAEVFDQDPSNDATEFKPTRLAPTALNTLRAGSDGAYPHSGILSMPTVMVRFPSSTSNQQRTRGARLILDRLLAIPVMKLSDFSTAKLPADADLELATQKYPACTVCHAAIDPIAGHFRNFGSSGQYRPASKLPNHLPPAGFLGETQSTSDTIDPVRWLGTRVAQHERFVLGVLMPVLADLIGAEILSPPSDVTAEGHLVKYLAFRIQQLEIQRLRREFAGGQNLRLKPLVKSILKGPFFRAVGSPETSAETSEALAMAGVGAGTLLTPEQLARKLENVTGLTYRGGLSPTGNDMFRNFREYRLMFGGTDWDSTPQRYREPNAIAVRIAMRTGNEMACLAVPQDFSIKDPNARHLFKNVTPATLPEGGGEALIRREIRRLHRLLLNEDLYEGHAELDETYKLWTSSRSAGLAAKGSTRVPTRCRAAASFTDPRVPYPDEQHDLIDEDPTYTVRAWMAVVAYLMSDARFFLQ
ncbi:MAG TPA: DUF1588 domain-containing protein [Polyangiaceae bacterium]|nr:DUF1588 domain-containing protein [Polyangiaceae bacterium]